MQRAKPSASQRSSTPETPPVHPGEIPSLTVTSRAATSAAGGAATSAGRTSCRRRHGHVAAARPRGGES